MRVSIRRFVAAAALLASLCIPPAASVTAQQPPPDVRGSYLVGGLLTIFGCTFEGSEIAVPFSAYLTVDQDGDAISGTLGYPEQQQYLLSFTGRVSPDGLVEGVFVFDQDPGTILFDETFRGEIADGNASVQFDATIGDEGASCRYRIAVASQSATLSWSAPDPNAAVLPPPRALTIADNPSVLAARSARDGDQLTGYNVYRSSTPGVQPSPENLFTSVPPEQTSVSTSVDASGSFFVVTATYEDGESGPSNEVSGGVPAATLANVKVSATKIRATGEGFSPTVQVFVDGIPFVAPAKVKGGRKVTQKGALLTGQSLAQYITPGRTVAITFRNENGGVVTHVYTKP